MYWSKDPLLGVSAVADVLSRDRFRQISRYFHADSEQYIPRGQPGHEPLFKIRPAIDKVLKSCQSYYSSGVAISIGETMIPFQGRLHFKQYIKNKPHPWGVKVWCCCDPSNGYMLDFRFYTGKKEAPIPHGLGHHVVMTLASRFLDKNHHFYFDNYFSSARLVKDLLTRSTYSCATTRQNRKDWPRDLRSKINKGECRKEKWETLLPPFGMTIISTDASPEMATAMRRTKEGPQQKEIPMPVLYYNANMAGVDLNDQLLTYYSIGRKSMKWSRCCFWYLCELALLNAFLFYKSMPRPPGSKPLDPFQFHVSIARALCEGGAPRGTGT